MTDHTGDGRYILRAGRRWRATDPMIAPERPAELRSALMAWWEQTATVLRKIIAGWRNRVGTTFQEIATFSAPSIAPDGNSRPTSCSPAPSPPIGTGPATRHLLAGRSRHATHHEHATDQAKGYKLS